ncbi:rab32, member RAS oncoprotein [Apophysomyces sp. BC1034]|nr:rab32, member RAS oncoprotein [Apophysomyces sp. BC1015]KAG0182275.1 rab32, member RAS oncoprotein [Apophysomyces sp. BC1021]KAG0192894.1 rab32, member RAS oncoprotein [Apophysomyces sp. BC1034]
MREYLYKILVVGDLGAGKTSIIQRYVNNMFSNNYKSTIGVDFALKIVQYSPDVVVRLQLWDIAGQERFGSMTRVYYKEALGALVVYDRTRPATFDGVIKWKKDIDEKISLPEAWGGGRIPVVLLANKSDLVPDIRISRDEMDQFCSEHGFIQWFETSAKNNDNIDEAARHLVNAILSIEEEQGEPFEENDETTIHLDQIKDSDTGGKCC